MKKILFLLGAFVLISTFSVKTAFADDTDIISEPTENGEINEPDNAEGEPAPAEEPIEEPEKAEETETPVEVEEKTDNAVEEFLNKYFSADKVAMYMSWLAYISTILGLVVYVKKLRNEKQLTLKNVTEMISTVIKEVSAEEITKEVEKFLPDILKTQTNTNDILKSFSKVLALSQENTPESRVAILHLIEEMGTIGKEITENAKVVIKEEVKLIEEHKEEVEKKLDEIINNYDGTSI